MTILILGRNGKTSHRLASLLRQNRIPHVVGCRSPAADGLSQHTLFDWLDEDTYDTALNSSPGGIKSIYMVAPEVADCFTPMKKFIESARQRGAKRFLLLSSSAIGKGDMFFGKVHEYLSTLDVEYEVLRPSWFQENFIEGHNLAGILHERKIYSAAQDGRVPFVSADDIALAAFYLLTNAKSYNTDHFIRGPDLLTYEEVASIISETIGQPVQHEKLTVAGLQGKLIEYGMPVEYAQALAKLDRHIAKGLEAQLDDELQKLIGRAPKSFRTFACESREKWLPEQT